MSLSNVYKLPQRRYIENRAEKLPGKEDLRQKKLRSTVRKSPVRILQVFEGRGALAAGRPPKVKENTAKKAFPLQFRPVSRKRRKTKTRGSLVLNLINLLLFGLLIFLGLHTVKHVRNAVREPAFSAAGSTTRPYTVSEPETSARPLNDYQIIWERNLFNTSPKEASASKKEIEIEKLPPAQTDLGLNLVGTVVADDPRLSRGFIDNQLTGKQEIFSEGDRVGEVLIKKILRNKVVVTTGKGDKLLTAEFEQPGKPPQTFQPLLQAAVSVPPPQASSTAAVDFRLKQSEVRSYLGDYDKLTEEVRIDPYTENDLPAGFKLGGIMGWNVLAQMGLRNGDVITGVNSEKISDPIEAAGFFEKLSEGGDIILEVIRRRRPVQIHLNIN